ncbi:hypothetical protein [Aedoeadaptatus coli]|uniref:hypothetical protein n=1 Tax=Aedoeadaptatus coli TaxID=2058292 RepID=UPI000D54AF7A|nr:hypothetical protein [Peptoniphilus coli]
MNESKLLPTPLELGQRYRVTCNAGKRKETSHEGVISGDYGRFYLMHLDDGTKETVLKNDLYRETTVVEALETDDDSEPMKVVVEGDSLARRLKDLYRDVMDYDAAIREGEAAQEKRRAAVAEIRALTDEFLEGTEDEARGDA